MKLGYMYAKYSANRYVKNIDNAENSISGSLVLRQPIMLLDGIP